MGVHRVLARRGRRRGPHAGLVVGRIHQETRCAMGLRMHMAGSRCGAFGVGSAFRQTGSSDCLVTHEAEVTRFSSCCPAAASFCYTKRVWHVVQHGAAWSGVEPPGAARRLGTAHAGGRHAGRPPDRTAPGAARWIAPGVLASPHAPHDRVKEAHRVCSS